MALSTSTAIASAAADIAGQGISRSLFGIANLIARSAENIRANKQAAIALSRRTNEIVTTLAAVLENDDAIEAVKDWREALARFQALLSAVQEAMQEQERRNYLAQLLHQERDRERLDDLAERVQDAFGVLMLQIKMNMVEAVHGIAVPFETTAAFDQLKSTRKAIISAAALSPQLALPQPPSLFFGRGKEIQAAVDIIVAPTAGHLVILGGPGMGKTTLALSVLHHPDVISRFQSRRYFVPCDASEGNSNCINILGGAFGIASSDPKVVRKRLAAVSTSMLKRGAGGHRLNALDVSITLSLMSPRIQAVPDAVKLLSLLALLPRGVIDTDLRHWASELSSRALPALLQAALAYRTSEQRVHALAPIRAFVLARHPPSDDILRPLYRHYFGLAAVLVSNSRSGSRPKAIAAVAPELENLAFIIQYALKHSQTAEEAVKATVQLCVLYHSTTLGPGPDLVADALKVARQSGLEELTADLLHHWATMCYNSSLSGDAPELYEEARGIYERIGNVDGVLDTSTRLIIYMDDEEASIVEGKRLWELAVSRNDARRAAACCHKIGDQCQGIGRHEEAISWYDRAITTIRETNEAADRIIGYSMYQTANSYQEMGRVRDAIALFEQAMPHLQAAENTFGICVVYFSLGEIYLEQGFWQRAVEDIEQALEAGAMEYRFNITLLRSLVLAYLAGDDEAGVMRTLALMEPLGTGKPIHRVHILLARLELAIWHGELDEAKPLARPAL
ncbi:TPR-like protein [Auricularia subglabra TFB-10046 SS5]|nr:TPR-like protein [Auricularia subglabra TFB-10046 SS5]